MRQRRPPGQSGFTYVEVLVAAVVALFGIFGIMSVFPRAMSTTDYAGRTTVLNHLALEKLDEIRSKGFADSDLDPGVHPAMANDSSMQKYYPVPGFGEDWSLRWLVTEDEPEGGIKQVIVEATYLVRYTIAGSPITDEKSRTVYMRTYITY